MCNMFSFNESTALSRCKDSSGRYLEETNNSMCVTSTRFSTEILACTERQFVRTYPAGVRIESSNYDPIPLWNHGVHMVALNIQTPGRYSYLYSNILFTDAYSSHIKVVFYCVFLDNFLFLNQGKFRQNGGCGYILKPKVMRNPTGTGS